MKSTLCCRCGCCRVLCRVRCAVQVWCFHQRCISSKDC
jgi:hypothetical protein